MLCIRVQPVVQIQCRHVHAQRVDFKLHELPCREITLKLEPVPDVVTQLEILRSSWNVIVGLLTRTILPLLVRQQVPDVTLHGLGGSVAGKIENKVRGVRRWKCEPEAGAHGEIFRHREAPLRVVSCPTVGAGVNSHRPRSREDPLT
ncbi:hypothetical protein ES703_101337 [subsurface metagenome]